ncbi:MAG: glycosyltransferase family 2 protein [Clostridia bacterium]|nr:glycosyltransferase family 2 protein [Clostridia bacterium]
MSNNPMVSLIIPFYNGENFVSRAVENLKKQDFRNFEIILVNDGSVDNTAQELENVKQNNADLDITVINKENGGVSTARNQGIDAAKGEWICFVDDDDVPSNDYISSLLSAVGENDTKLAFGFFTREYSELNKQTSYNVKVYEDKSFLREFLYNGINYHHCAAIFNKSLFEDGTRYPEGQKYSEDVHLLWRLLSVNERVAVVEKPIYFYSFNPDSAMNKKMTLDRLGAVSLMKELEPIIEKNAPKFYPEYKNFAVARHNWSILWQAAGNFNSFNEFKKYVGNFEMESELKKLYTYPSKKVALTSRLFNFSPFVYYVLMRVYVRYFK